MGRPPKDELSVRSEQLRMRLTKAEHAWIKTYAKEKKISMREAVCRAFFDNIKNLPVDQFSEMNARVVQEMKRKK